MKKRIFKSVLVVLLVSLAVFTFQSSAKPKKSEEVGQKMQGDNKIKEKKNGVEEKVNEDQRFLDSLSLEVIQRYKNEKKGIKTLVTDFKKVRNKKTADKLGVIQHRTLNLDNEKILVPKIGLTGNNEIVKFNVKGEKEKVVKLKKHHRLSKFSISPNGTVITEKIPKSTSYENKDGEIYFYDNNGKIKWKAEGDVAHFSPDDRIITTKAYTTGKINVYKDTKKVYEIESPGRYYEDGTGVETIVHTAYGKKIWAIVLGDGRCICCKIPNGYEYINIYITLSLNRGKIS